MKFKDSFFIFTGNITSMKSTAKNVTPREREVLGLLARGMSYRGIATELGITAETVKKHLKNIYRKLKVSNKIEALMKFRFL